MDGKARRMKVQVPRGGATVRAREIFDVRTYEDRDWAARLASALDGPVPATGVGLRVTSYLSADPDDATRLRLLVVRRSAPAQPGEATFQLAVSDLKGKKIPAGRGAARRRRTATRCRSRRTSPCRPGSYIVRLGVMDSAGRVGSVDHRVEARDVPLGSLTATGPVLVRVPSGPEGEARARAGRRATGRAARARGRPRRRTRAGSRAPAWCSRLPPRPTARRSFTRRRPCRPARARARCSRRVSRTCGSCRRAPTSRARRSRRAGSGLAKCGARLR